MNTGKRQKRKPVKKKGKRQEETQNQENECKGRERRGRMPGSGK